MDQQEKEAAQVEAPSGVPMGRAPTDEDRRAWQSGGDVNHGISAPARVSKAMPGGTPIAKAPDPGIPYNLVPKERYTHPKYFDLEWEKLWKKVWTLAGRVDDIPQPGDFFTHDLGKESFLITRDSTGAIRAYYNVCLHRGNRLKHMQGFGHAASFQCTYHHWEWDIDGSVKRIPDPETYRQELDHDCLKLKEAQADIWGGFVFINMNPDAEPLRDYLSVVPEHLDPYHLQDMVKISDMTVEWDCNWKTTMDAFNETYHVQGVHPQVMSWMDDYHVQIDVYDKHSRMTIPMGIPSVRYKNQDESHTDLDQFLEDAGLDADDFRERPREARRAIQERRRAAQDETHLPHKFLNDDQLSDDYHYTLFPNCTMNLYADAMMLFLSRPHPSDPNKMLWDLQFYVYPDPSEPRPEPPERTYHKYDDVDLGEVLEQDAFNLPYVQAGMNSDVYEGLILSKQEERILAFHNSWAEYVEPENAVKTKA